MTLRAALETDAQTFRNHVQTKFPNAPHTDHARALERLIDWSVGNESLLIHAPSDGSDPKVGVAEVRSGLKVWRVFPRKDDGAKVTLMPSSGSEIDESLHKLIADILDGLRPDTPIESGKELEVGLQTIASHTGWRRFKAALQCTLDARVDEPEVDV
jgi:hypothetical protein